MSTFIQFLYLLGLSLWVGGIVFFSFFTTPTVFTQLPKEMAGTFLSALFPKYYLLGYGSGTLMLIASLAEAALLRRWPWIRLAVLAVMLGASAYAGAVIRPRVHDLKIQMRAVEADSEVGKNLKAQFDAFHRRSVMLNVIVLLGGLLLIGIVAFRLRL